MSTNPRTLMPMSAAARIDPESEAPVPLVRLRIAKTAEIVTVEDVDDDESPLVSAVLRACRVSSRNK